MFFALRKPPGDGDRALTAVRLVIDRLKFGGRGPSPPPPRIGASGCLGVPLVGAEIYSLPPPLSGVLASSFFSSTFRTSVTFLLK